MLQSQGNTERIRRLTAGSHWERSLCLEWSSHGPQVQECCAQISNPILGLQQDIPIKLTCITAATKPQSEPQADARG